MQLITALDGPLRREHFPFSSLDEDANVLVFPDLQSGNEPDPRRPLSARPRAGPYNGPAGASPRAEPAARPIRPPETGPRRRP